MSIFGMKGVKTHLNTGTFTCPCCHSTQVYALKKISYFYSFFDLPLLPADKENTYVECQSCFNTYIPRVLNYDPSIGDDRFINQYQEVLTHILAMIVLTDPEESYQKRMLMLSMLKKFTSMDLILSDLEDILMHVSIHPEVTFEKLKVISPLLNQHGKELLLKSAVSVGAIDSPLSELEMVLITKMAQALGINSNHLAWLIQASHPRTAA